MACSSVSTAPELCEQHAVLPVTVQSACSTHSLQVACTAVCRTGARPSRGTGSADLEADSAAEQEAAEAAWAGQEGLSLDQRFTQQAAAGAAAAQAGRLRLRPQRWIRLPQGGARSEILEGSGMEGVRWATARRPAARRRLGAGSQDWQVAPTKVEHTQHALHCHHSKFWCETVSGRARHAQSCAVCRHCRTSARCCSVALLQAF